MFIRILLVDDFDLWRRFVHSILQKSSELQIIGEVSDGLAAVNESVKLRPDLILLDIGLPKLDGINAARKIHKSVPSSKILFLSLDSSAEVGQEALQIGAGFVVKSDAYKELVPAINTVMLGSQYLSSGMKRQTVGEDTGGLIFEPTTLV